MPASGKVKHGHKRRGATSLEYKTWIGIKRRCNRPNCKDYGKYGALGIRLSPEWDSSFEAFLADMGPRPSPKHQIDREDSSGNYEKGNCRWVTPTVQGQENRRSNIPVIVDGVEFKSLSAACRHFGINKTTACYRIGSGMTPEDAVKLGVNGFTPRRSRESYLARDHPDRLA
jgi:hypothetical protein